MNKGLLILTLFMALLSVSYSVKLIVRTNPPISNFGIVIFSESGGQNYYNTTNGYGEAVFNLPVGDYIVDINPTSGVYRFSNWETSGGVSILCSKTQIPLFIHVSGDGVLVANFTSSSGSISIVKLSVSSNLYEIFPVPFKLTYNGNTILKDNIVGSYELQIQKYKIYNISVPSSFNFGSVSCNFNSIYVNGITIIKKNQENNNETIEFSPTQYYTTFDIIYTCGSQTTEKKNIMDVTSYPINVNVDVNGTQHKTPYETTITNGHVYFIKYPISKEDYYLSNINLEGNYKVIFKNLSNGSIMLRADGSIIVSGVYNQGVVKYLLTVSSVPYKIEVCVKRMIDGWVYCNKTPYTITLPEDWYEVYTENKSFEAFIMNNVVYYDNPIKFALYQNTNIIAKVLPIQKIKTYNVGFGSNKPIELTVYNSTGVIASKNTPYNLKLPVGTYELKYPKYLENNYVFKGIQCFGFVDCINNTSIRVDGAGSIYLNYGNIPTTPSPSKCVLAIYTPYSLDKTYVYYENGTLYTIVTGSQSIVLKCGTYILKQKQTKYFDNFVRFYFRGWYFDGSLNTSKELKINLTKYIKIMKWKIVTVKKLFNIYYLVSIRLVYYNMTPVSNTEVAFNGNNTITNSSGYASAWILSGTNLNIDVPLCLSNLCTKAQEVRVYVNRPLSLLVVYYPKTTKVVKRRSIKLYNLTIYVKDSYLKPISGINILIYNSTGNLYYKGVSNGSGIIRFEIPPGKYYILALFRQGNWVIGKISGVEKCKGANYCEFKVNKSKTITVIYVNTSKKIGYLQLNIYDNITKKPLNCSVQICRLNVFNYSCFVGRSINGVYEALLTNGKYSVSVVCNGYNVSKFIVNLVNYFNKTVELVPINTSKIPTKNITTSKKYKLTIFSYPNVSIHVVGNGITRTVTTNSTGLATLELPVGQYVIYVGNKHRVVNLSSNMGVILKNLSAILPRKEASKFAKLSICVLVNNKPYTGFIYIKNINTNQTLKYYIEGGCRSFIFEKGDYAITVFNKTKVINLTNSTTVRFTINNNRPNIGFLIGYVAFLLVVLFGFIILLLRRYLGSRFFR